MPLYSLTRKLVLGVICTKTCGSGTLQVTGTKYECVERLLLPCNCKQRARTRVYFVYKKPWLCIEVEKGMCNGLNWSLQYTDNLFVVRWYVFQPLKQLRSAITRNNAIFFPSHVGYHALDPHSLQCITVKHHFLQSLLSLAVQTKESFSVLLNLYYIVCCCVCRKPRQQVRCASMHTREQCYSLEQHCTTPMSQVGRLYLLIHTC